MRKSAIFLALVVIIGVIAGLTHIANFPWSPDIIFYVSAIVSFLLPIPVYLVYKKIGQGEERHFWYLMSVGATLVSVGLLVNITCERQFAGQLSGVTASQALTFSGIAFITAALNSPEHPSMAKVAHASKPKYLLLMMIWIIAAFLVLLVRPIMVAMGYSLMQRQHSILLMSQTLCLLMALFTYWAYNPFGGALGKYVKMMMVGIALLALADILDVLVVLKLIAIPSTASFLEMVSFPAYFLFFYSILRYYETLSLEI